MLVYDLICSKGHTFEGWYTHALVQNETTLLDFDRAIMPAGGMILYAKWKEPSYKVTFDLNSGTGVAPAQTIIQGVVLVISLITYSILNDRARKKKIPH